MAYFISFVFVICVAYGIASVLNHKYYFYRRDRLVVLWFTFVIANNLIFHLPYVVVSLVYGPIEKSHDIFIVSVKDFGRADTRWLHNDPMILTGEIMAVTFEVLLAYFVIRGIVLATVYRQFCQIVACACQLYRFWFMIGPELLAGFPHLDRSNPFHLLMHVIVGNVLSLLLPALLLYESYLDLSTGVMRMITPYRWKSPRSSSRHMSGVRNRDSWFFHS